MLTIINKKTDVEAQVSPDEWDRIKESPEFKGIFKLKPNPKEPKEVADHKAKTKAATQTASAETDKS